MAAVAIPRLVFNDRWLARSGKCNMRCRFWDVACTDIPSSPPSVPQLSPSISAQRYGEVAQYLHLNFAFFFAVPVGNSIRLHLDEHNVRRVDALVEPTI
jgi:hypothetical protein